LVVVVPVDQRQRCRRRPCHDGPPSPLIRTADSLTVVPLNVPLRASPIALGNGLSRAHQLLLGPVPHFRVDLDTTPARGSARRRPVSARRPRGLLRVPPALPRAGQGKKRFASWLACQLGAQVGPPASLKLP
jgi:hypothetical protein